VDTKAPGISRSAGSLFQRHYASVCVDRGGYSYAFVSIIASV
jgi:hypothetical protein